MKINLSLLESSILERNYEMLLKDTFIIIEKNLNGMNGVAKDELLAYFLFLVIIIILPLMEEVDYLIFFINNDKKFF